MNLLVEEWTLRGTDKSVWYLQTFEQEFLEETFLTLGFPDPLENEISGKKWKFMFCKMRMLVLSWIKYWLVSMFFKYSNQCRAQLKSLGLQLGANAWFAATEMLYLRVAM